MRFLKSFFLLFFVVSQLVANAQISAADLKALQQKEDSLKLWAEYLSTDELQEDRMYSDSVFTKVLVRSLLIKNSFYYPFDSVKGISKLYAPDSTFRIFTWNLEYDANYHRQRGAIQMRTRDGSLKLFPLRDVSEFTSRPMDSIRTHQNWIGAIYYNIHLTNFNGKKFYTLFGLDNNSASSAKKWIEVLHFNTKGEPLFGGPYFNFGNGVVKNRVLLNYKKSARVVANYFPELEMLLLDHLISETDQPELPQTLIPGGDYEGFKWDKGKWQFVSKVFKEALMDGQAPRENPLYDNKPVRNN